MRFSTNFGAVTQKIPRGWPQKRIFALFFSILLAFLTGLSGILTPATDNLGHLGGFLIGFTFAPALMPAISSSSNYLIVRNYRKISFFVSMAYFVAMFYTLYTMRVNRVIFKCD